MDAVFELKQKQLNLVEKKQAKVKNAFKARSSFYMFVCSDYRGKRKVNCEETKGETIQDQIRI